MEVGGVSAWISDRQKKGRWMGGRVGCVRWVRLVVSGGVKAPACRQLMNKPGRLAEVNGDPEVGAASFLFVEGLVMVSTGFRLATGTD